LAYLIAVLPELVAEIECSVRQPSAQAIRQMGRFLAPLVGLMKWALRHDTDRASLLVDSGEGESWGGRMVEIEKHVQRSANATFEHIHTLQTHLSAMDGKMDDIQEKLGANAALEYIRTLQTHVSTVDVKMDAIQEKLDRVLQQDSAGQRYSNSRGEGNL
jgi:hypothetical protein